MLKARVPQTPSCGAKTEGEKRQRGVICFGYFALDKQRKVTRMSRESDGLTVCKLKCFAHSTLARMSRESDGLTECKFTNDKIKNQGY